MIDQSRAGRGIDSHGDRRCRDGASVGSRRRVGRGYGRADSLCAPSCGQGVSRAVNVVRDHHLRRIGGRRRQGRGIPVDNRGGSGRNRHAHYRDCDLGRRRLVVRSRASD